MLDGYQLHVYGVCINWRARRCTSQQKDLKRLAIVDNSNIIEQKAEAEMIKAEIKRRNPDNLRIAGNKLF